MRVPLYRKESVEGDNHWSHDEAFGAGELADAGEGVADQQVNDPGAAERGLQLDDAGLVLADPPDDRRLLKASTGAPQSSRN